MLCVLPGPLREVFRITAVHIVQQRNRRIQCSPDVLVSEIDDRCRPSYSDFCILGRGSTIVY